MDKRKIKTKHRRSVTASLNMPMPSMVKIDSFKPQSNQKAHFNHISKKSKEKPTIATISKTRK